MFSKTFLYVVVFATLATVILSIPADIPSKDAPQLVERVETIVEEIELEPETNIGMDMQVAQTRFLQNFFNLSTYLVNAPNDSAALTFVPLGSLLFSKG